MAPVDGSAASERIIPHLAELRRAVDAEVSLIHVTDADPVAQLKGRDYLKSLEERAEGILPIRRCALRTGEPAFEILKYAGVERADLIAFTTRGATPVRRVVFGNTAIELLRAGRIPLLIARPERPARPLRRILAAIDASSDTRAVIDWVSELARGGDAEIALVRVLGGSDAPDKAAASMDRVAGFLEKKAGRVESRLASGDPAGSILREARDRSADLIALGIRGRRGTDRFFFGSVAESVLVGSEIPVLLCRRGRTARIPRTLARGTRK